MVRLGQHPSVSWIRPYHDTASAPALSADEGVVVHKVVCGHLVKERGLPLRAGALRRLQQPKICGSRLQVHNLITCWSQAVAEIAVSVGVGVRADTNLDRTELEQEPIKGQQEPIREPSKAGVPGPT